jgi:phosphotriesterase-related protein
VDATHITLSHVDQVVDREYHREILRAGAFVEYDQAFRWGDNADGTTKLVGWMVEDGLSGGIVLGMDAARRRYLRVFGGSPGLAWLLEGYVPRLERAGVESAVRRRLFVDNPARAFAFAEARP